MAIIRPSSLPGYNDCAKKTAAKLFPKEIALLGYELNRSLPGYGSAIGHSLHSAAKRMHLAKRDGQQIPSVADLMDEAAEEFDKETAEGVIEDSTTKNRDTAMKQMTQQLSTYRAYVLPKLQPKLVEEKFTEQIRDDITLEGTIDLMTTDGLLHDAKFGTKLGAFQAQLGLYYRLVKNNGQDVTGLVVDWVKRVGKTAAPAEPKSIPYEVEPAYKQASETVKRIIADRDRFLATGDPYSFPMNPSTMLCSAKYCTAWGTKFCDQWRANTNDD